MNSKTIEIPKRLADKLDTYYQTSAFAQKNFTKFDKSFVLNMVTEEANRLGYTVEVSEGKNAGQFTFSRPTRVMKVTRKTFPKAQVLN